MSDPEFQTPVPGGPPPLPPGYVPPLLQGRSYPPPTPMTAPPTPEAEIAFTPTLYVESEDKRGGIPAWMLWAAPGLIVLMIGVGAAAIVATRSGPSRATAGGYGRNRAVPSRPTAPTAAAPHTRGGPTFRPLPPPAASNAVRPPRQAGTTDRPLPSVANVDLQLRDLWRAAEAQGITVRTVTTLRATRDSELTVQPVQLNLTCDFPKAVLFLQSVRESMPSAVPGLFEVTRPAKRTPGPAGLSVTMTLYLYCAGGAGAATTPPADVSDLRPLPDVVGALAEAAKIVEGRFPLQSVSLKVNGAASASTLSLRPSVTLVGTAETNADAAEVVRRLKQSERFVDVTLVAADRQRPGATGGRNSMIEFDVPGRHGPEPTAAAALRAADVPDPFRLGSQEPGGAAAPTPAADPAVERDRAQRALDELVLESVVDGSPRTCVISGRLYRQGNGVDGFTIEKINDDGVVLRRGESRFELKVKK